MRMIKHTGYRKLSAALFIFTVFILFAGDSIPDARPPLSAMNAFSDGLIAQQAGYSAEALALFKRAAVLDSTSADILWELFFLAQDLSEYKTAEEAGEKLVKLIPDDDELRGGLIQLYLETEDYIKALANMEVVYKRHPDDIGVIIDLSKLYIINQDTVNAVEILKKAKKKFGSDPDILKAIGDVYLEAGLLDNAEPVFLDIIKKNPDFTQAYLGLALIYEQRKDYTTAKEHYNRYFELSGRTSEIFLSYLALLSRGGMTNDAIIEAKRYLADNPTDKDVMRRLGFMLLSQNRPQEALGSLIESYEGEKAPSTAYYIAEIYGSLGKLDSAKSYWELYINTVKTLSANLEYAQFLLEYNDTATAVAIANTMRTTYPDSSLVDMFFGFYDMEKGAFADALPFFISANKKNPRDDKTLFALGDAYERLGQSDSAISIMKKLLEIRPDDPMVKNYLGYILAESNKELALADSLVSAALIAEPENGAYLDSYAWILYRKGEFDKALDYINRALAGINTDFLVHDHKGDILLATGDKTSAVSSWQTALSLAKTEQDKKSITKKIDLYTKSTGNLNKD